MAPRRRSYFDLRSGSLIFAANQNFVPDATFKGSDLKGWHTLGEAEWHAQNGEIFAKPKQESGGWLVLDHGYQDVELSLSFRCEGPCKTGVLLRDGKAAEGSNGVYLSLSDDDVAPYHLVLDAQGKEVSRTKLPSGPGPMIRMSMARFSGSEDLVPGFSKPAVPPPPPASKAAPSNTGGRGRGGHGGAQFMAATGIPCRSSWMRMYSRRVSMAEGA